MTAPYNWPTSGPLANVPPASDLVLAELRSSALNVRTHDHPLHQDLYCLNLVAYMGERMVYVLRRLADKEGEVRALKDRLTALADEAIELAERRED